MLFKPRCSIAPAAAAALLLAGCLAGCVTNPCENAPKYRVDLAHSTNCLVDFGYDPGSTDFRVMSANDGVACVIHRITKGLDVQDGDYQWREAQARAANMKWGAYHFGTPCASEEEAIRQADRFLDSIRRAARANRTSGLPILLVLDVENVGDTGAHMNLNYAAAFLRRVRDVTGKYPGFYTNPCELMDAFSDLSQENADTLRQCWLWASCFSYRPVALPLWPRWTFWQYTGDVDGAVRAPLPTQPYTPELAGFSRPENESRAMPDGRSTHHSADRSLFNGSLADFELFWDTHAVSIPY
jgi:lysozyme